MLRTLYTNLAVSIFAVLVLPPFAAAETITAAGKVTAVTVYQGQALVTREIDLAAARGLTEVVVTELPARLTPGSLYAEPVGDVEVRSVRYRTRPVAEDSREEVQQLDQQLEQLRDQLAAVQMEVGLFEARAKYLGKLENFTTQTASKELASGVLDATTLNELTKTIFEGRAEVAAGRLKAQQQARALNAELQVVNRQRQQLTSNSSRTLREAVVFVDAPAEGGRLRLTYLVTGASWSPSYNLRASDARDQVMVEYNASITQQSGEDWSDVRMTLSTASPSLVATAPQLERLTIRLGKPASAAPALGRESDLREQQLSQQQKSLSINRGNFYSYFEGQESSGGSSVQDGEDGDGLEEQSGLKWFRGGGGGGFGAATGDVSALIAENDRGLNRLSNAIQVLQCSSPTPHFHNGHQTPGSSGISVVYELKNRTSLPSRSDQQLIAIAKLPLDGEFYRVARPLLTEFVYEEVRVVNSTGVVLLAGPAATYLGSRFVGRGATPTVAVGESFTIGLGIDESLRATRELVKKQHRVQGGNRVATLDLRLRIENFGSAAKSVRLYDRLPSADDAEIKVSLVASQPAPADTPKPLRKSGILRWDVEAPANDQTAGATTVEYQMQLEYDRNRSIVEAVAAN